MSDDRISAEAHRVRFAGAPRPLPIRRGESVLEAAVRGGLDVSYGCTDGRCGLCRARLEDGELAQLRATEYALSEADKLDGCFLMCAHTAASNLSVRADFGRENDQARQLDARVTKVAPLSGGVSAATLRPPRGERLRFRAGQYARLSGAGATLDCAIASCPCEERTLEFHLPDAAREALACRVGARLRADAPHGDFVFRESGRPVCMFAWETGFAPLSSLLEHITAQESELPIFLYWLAATPEMHYRDNQCRAWADALDQLRYTRATTPDDAAVARFAAELEGAPAALSDCDVYVCMPPRLGAQIAAACAARGAPPARIFQEIPRPAAAPQRGADAA